MEERDEAHHRLEKPLHQSAPVAAPSARCPLAVPAPCAALRKQPPPTSFSGTASHSLDPLAANPILNMSLRNLTNQVNPTNLPYALDVSTPLSSSELSVLRGQYEKERASGHATTQTKFNYAWGLVKSEKREEVGEGVGVLAGECGERPGGGCRERERKFSVEGERTWRKGRSGLTALAAVGVSCSGPDMR